MKAYLAIKWVDVGWVDHSCMYFTPIRFEILSRTNQIAACMYGSFLYGHFCFAIDSTLFGRVGLKSLFQFLIFM